jgi:hypothetical protein
MSYTTPYISIFPGSKRFHFVFAIVFAATITSHGLASAEQGPNGSPSQAVCDSVKKRTCDELVQDNILWRIDQPDNPASKHWLQKNLDDLCACTSDPYATVNCFQIQVNNNRKTWQEAIATCRAKP